MKNFFLSIFCISFLFATDKNTKIYTYEILLDETLQNSPAYNISKLDIQSADATIEKNKSAFYPTLSLGANTQYSDSYHDTSTLYVGDSSLISTSAYQDSASLNLRYDIYKFGADKLTLEASQKSKEAKIYQKCQSGIDLSLKLLDNYAKALTLHNQIIYQENLIKSYSSLHSYAKRLNSAGELDKIKVNNYALKANEAQDRLQSHKISLQNTVSQLILISGVKELKDYMLSDLYSTSEIYALPEFESSYMAMAFDKQIEENTKLLEAAKKAYYPTIFLYAGYDFYGGDRNSYAKAHGNFDKQGWRAGLGFRFEIFDGGRRSAQVKEHEIEAKRLEYKKRQAKLEYEQQKRDLEYFLLSNADKKRLLEEIYKDSKTAKNMQARLNESGESSKIDVLEMLVSQLERELELNNFLIEIAYNNKKSMILSAQTAECKE